MLWDINYPKAVNACNEKHVDLYLIVFCMFNKYIYNMYNIILYFPKTTLIFIIINLSLFCGVKVL